MKRVYIAVTLLCLCAVFCVYSFVTITKDCKELIAQTKTVQNLTESGNQEAAFKQAQTIKKLWQQYSLPFSLLTTHTHYDSLEECVDKLYHACQSGENKEITTASDDLIFEATHIIASIQPKAENVF